MFARLCSVIDELLGDNKRGFTWRQIKEKMGSTRFHYTLEFFSKESDDPEQGKYVRTFEEEKLADELALLIHFASRMTELRRVVCGRNGTVQSHEGNDLAVCETHQAQWLAGRWVQDFYLDDGTDQKDLS